MEDTINVQVFNSFDEIASMQQEWDDFVEPIGGEIFLTYDWCRVWWKYYGKRRDLLVFVFKNNGSLCGILPMFLEKIWLGPVCVRVVKIVGTDFLPITVTVPVSHDVIYEVIHSFINKLRANYNWDILYIGAICGRYDSFDRLVGACAQATDSTCHVETKTSGVQTYIKVAASWDDQLAIFSRKRRAEMRRKYDRILKQGIQLESIPATDDNFKQFFENFVQMHQSYWQSLGYSGHFGAWPEAYKFHREVAAVQLNRQRLKFYKIVLDGHSIGYRYSYKFGDTYYNYLYARSQFGKSKKIDFTRIDFGEMVKRAVKEDVKWFDFMRGKYNHKLQLGGQMFPINNIYIYSNKLPSMIRVNVFRSLAWMLNVCYSKIWRDRIAHRLGLKLGPFWKAWLRFHMLTY
jgi:CelD/BcsL family acetyltransferase involved in cellulose biosynthesis